VVVQENLSKIAHGDFLHSRLGFHAWCDASGFRWYSHLAYAGGGGDCDDSTAIRWWHPRSPRGNAPGATANRVALEACIQARNEAGLAREGNDVIREAAKWSPELAVACELWKEIKFEFQAMDTI